MGSCLWNSRHVGKGVIWDHLRVLNEQFAPHDECVVGKASIGGYVCGIITHLQISHKLLIPTGAGPLTIKGPCIAKPVRTSMPSFFNPHFSKARLCAIEVHGSHFLSSKSCTNFS